MAQLARSQSQQVSDLPIVSHPVADFLHHSSDRRIPLRFYQVAFVTRGSRESYFWDHNANYRPLRELGDTSTYLCFCLCVCRVELCNYYCLAVAIRAAWEGVIVIVDT